MQWSATNIRNMLELLSSGYLKQAALYDYLAYTVSEVAESYMW